MLKTKSENEREPNLIAVQTRRKGEKRGIQLKIDVLDLLPDALFIRDMKGTIIYANDAMCWLYGYDRDELIGMDTRKLLAPEGSEFFGTKVEEARQRREAVFEVLHWRKDNSRIPIEVHTQIIEFSGNEYVINVIRDITEQKLAERALIESEEKFRNLFENTPIGLAIASVDGTSVERNMTLQKMLGYDSKEELVKTRAEEHYFDPNDRKRFLDLHRKGPVTNFEVKFKRKDGTPFWISMTSIPYKDKTGDKFITVTQDVTERKKAEEDLKASEAKFRNLLENAPVGIAITTIDGKPIVRNKKMTQLFGYTQKDYFTKPVSPRYYNPKDRERLLELTKKGLVENFETRVRHKDGSILWTTHTTIPQKTEFGDCFISVIQDITERKKTERKLERYHQRLRFLASKLSLAEEEERRRIAVGIHDSISQSLATCHFMLTDLHERLSSSPLLPKVTQIQDMMKQSIKELRSLTFDLSCPLLYEAGLEAAIANLTEEIGSQYKIEADFVATPRPESLILDKDMSVLLYQVVRELLVNVGKHAKAKRLRVHMKITPKYVQIITKDDGIGFDVSKTVTLNRLNSGFGLFSIRERLLYLGGRLVIQSSPGRGTRAIVKTPIIIRKLSPSNKRITGK